MLEKDIVYLQNEKGIIEAYAYKNGTNRIVNETLERIKTPNKSDVPSNAGISVQTSNEGTWDRVSSETRKKEVPQPFRIMEEGERKTTHR